jgi:multiple sugar transport system permease protein
VPPDADPKIRALWQKYLTSGFQLRHVQIPVSPARQQAFLGFLRERFRNLTYFNSVMGGTEQEWQPVLSWEEVRLTPTTPTGPLAKVWMDFIRQDVPVGEWVIRDTLPELAFQEFALQKHGSLQGVNDAYGLKLGRIQELGIPFGEAILVTFANRQLAFTLDGLTTNFRTVGDYLFTRGLAVRNTVILVILAIVITLTVNPLAGYALSRFRLRQTEKVIIFCLATMAFPAAVAAIPGFLLLRDMGLLNTFAALVLPGAANGMTIFLLKGFFDSLPKELYEAAAIDGAPEWQVFVRISLPLVKPILAVSMLNAFLAAYNGWEWAIIVCQDPKMWTVAVWTYQFSQTLVAQPFTVMAAFIVNSIPVLIVFLFCQKVILRGIILPQLK